MGNRKRLKDNSKRLKKNPSILQRGIAAIAKPSGPRPMTHDEAMANPDLIGDLDLDPTAFASESDIIKIVPAKHKGTTVGDAMIHEDGQVTIKFHDDAPQWAIDEIKAVAGSIGYNLEAGTPDGPA